MLRMTGAHSCRRLRKLPRARDSLAPAGHQLLHAYSPANEPWELWQHLETGSAAYEALKRERDTRWLVCLQRFGPKTLLLSWLPIVGDPLCALAGWLAMPFWPCVLWMAIGKLLRYATITTFLLWVPDSVWRALLLMA